MNIFCNFFIVGNGAFLRVLYDMLFSKNTFYCCFRLGLDTCVNHNLINCSSFLEGMSCFWICFDYLEPLLVMLAILAIDQEFRSMCWTWNSFGSILSTPSSCYGEGWILWKAHPWHACPCGKCLLWISVASPNSIVHFVPNAARPKNVVSVFQ